MISKFSCQLDGPEAMNVERDLPPNGASLRDVGSELRGQFRRHPVVRFHEAIRADGVHGQEAGNAACVGAVVERHKSGTQHLLCRLAKVEATGICQWRAAVEAHWHFVEEDACGL
jgi:hypothetical protein